MDRLEHVSAGIVITAQTFNPSIYSEVWLVQSGVIAPDTLEGMRIFSPELVQFQTGEMQLLVTPPKMQITFPLPGTEVQSTVPQDTAAAIVGLLPHTPYHALGLNFDFFMATPPGKNICAHSRALFGGGNDQLLEEFTSDDAKFGRYFSKNYGEARLKLDIKPVIAGPEGKDLLRYSFNFNHDVSQVETDQRATKLIQLIGTWGKLHEHAEHLVELGIRLTGESQ